MALGGRAVFDPGRERLPVTAAEVVVELYLPAGDVFGEPEAACANYTRFRISPKVVIALGGRSKAARRGEAGRGRRGRM